MERVLSQDERIRRAEELYARRRMINESRTSATVNVEGASEGKLTKKLVIQFVLCIIIYTCFYAAKNLPNLVPQEVMYKISDVLEYDINIQELYSKFNSLSTETKKEEKSNNENKLVEETLSATDSIEITDESQNNIINSENIVTESVEPQPAENTETKVEENISSMSQMEIDANYIKANCIIMKPLDGEITSRFGPRNPEVPTVPKYHTGIDIARVTGTAILAAMEGNVELVSTEGDYGNHVKITAGDVSTLYAHCSKIYVNQGEHITQGQPIAEVGATGNVTGPHLHFEIRRNNEYVDPDLILDF